jgi:hypothetical protein
VIALSIAQKSLPEEPVIFRYHRVQLYFFYQNGETTSYIYDIGGQSITRVEPINMSHPVGVIANLADDSYLKYHMDIISYKYFRSNVGVLL